MLARLLAPEHLTRQLARHRDLAGTRVLAATPRTIDAAGYLSDLVGVTLDWSTPDAGPARAVLKVSHAAFGQRELPFYEEIAARVDSPVLPRFFAGGTDEPTGRTWLLLEDLSASHEVPSAAPMPPTFERSARLVEALAQLHAAAWDQPALQGTEATLLARLRASGWIEDAAARLFAQAGDALDGGTRDLYARWLRSLPALVERAAHIPGNTIVHGDAHAWNWMLPRPGAAAPPKLVDWDGWAVGPGVWDLAYMMAVFWDREVRQRFEAGLLDRYHASLVAAGVRGYPRDALQEDYRLAVLLHLRTPLARFHWKMSAYVWWPQITRIRHAVEDLRADDLLG